MKLVQFKNGKFGIRVGFWPMYEYIGEGHTWMTDVYVQKYCMFDTEGNAMQAYHDYIAKNPKVSTAHKVLRSL